MTVYEALFYCIRSEMGSLKEELNVQLSYENFEKLYKLAEHHDLSHIVGNALIKSEGLSHDTDLYKKLQKKIMLAYYRFEKLNYDFQQVTSTLEKEQIRFIPLKGAVLRDLYPEKWFRTSCDVDILIEKCNLEKATECLIKAGLKKGEESPHDITFWTPSGSNIEIHYSLIEDEKVNNIDVILNQVWERTALHSGYSYWYDMSDEMFYFYHIAHMAKHVLFGGCGIKSFIDLWLLDNMEGVESAKRTELLAQGNLLNFTRIAQKLSSVWLENSEADSKTEQLEEYILRGGVYGTDENRISIQQQKQGGRIKYTISKLFLPYEQLKYQYPILKKHRWLTPIVEIVRWVELVFGGKAKQNMRQLKSAQNVSVKENINPEDFLKNIGL